METAHTSQIASAFIWRRVHSLTGFWLVLYLTLHLLTNSQAALWLGETGAGFVRMVNQLESLPYLYAIEIFLIGMPLVIHAVWGIHRAWTAKNNVDRSDGSKPSLHFTRNWAFYLQRISSWVLLFGLVGHVIQMRFLDQPRTIEFQNQDCFVVEISRDKMLEALSERLGVRLYDGSEEDALAPLLIQKRLKLEYVYAVATTPGTAILLMVRDTFKSPLMIILYTLFVLAAAFHAFNGFWTFLITWGILLSFRSQKAMIPVSVIGMGLLLFFGLAAIWGSYWVNQYG